VRREVKKKLICFISLVSVQVSTVAGEGYRQAVNRTLNPSSVEQVMVLYETFGWYFAGFLAVPFLGMLVYGWVLGEWRRENYWLLLILGIILGFAVVVLFPFGLKLV
jgi:lipopolysaccharide export LptBFGC system permease protein LptF